MEAGADWRQPGCSMCIAMNGDQLEPGQYAVSTSNRNFEGRQGKGGRTFLASPLTAAATALDRQNHRCEGDDLMAQFTTLTARGLPLPVDNIDTDQIIPARFLKTTDKSGLGERSLCRLALPGGWLAASGFPAERRSAMQGLKSWWPAIILPVARPASTPPGRWLDYGFRGSDFHIFRRYFPQQQLEKRASAHHP